MFWGASTQRDECMREGRLQQLGDALDPPLS